MTHVLKVTFTGSLPLSGMGIESLKDAAEKTEKLKQAIDGLGFTDTKLDTKAMTTRKPRQATQGGAEAGSGSGGR